MTEFEQAPEAPVPAPPGAPVPGPAEVVSPDGQHVWDGTAWQPRQQLMAPPPPMQPSPIASQVAPPAFHDVTAQAGMMAQATATGMPAPGSRSPDGHWVSDGRTWLPAATAPGYLTGAAPQQGFNYQAAPGATQPVIVIQNQVGGMQGRPVTTRSRTVAILLALFLGGIGVHRFYLGKPASGIAYLLFFWTFIPAFLALIEIIILLFTDDLRFAQKYPTGYA